MQTVYVNATFEPGANGRVRQIKKVLVHRNLPGGGVACRVPAPILTTDTRSSTTCPSCLIPGEHERHVVLRS